MEQLRIFPLALFFVGGLLLYAGITDRTVSEIVRGTLNNNAPANRQQDLFSEDRPPFYAGIMTYRRPQQYSDRFFFG